MPSHFAPVRTQRWSRRGAVGDRVGYELVEKLGAEMSTFYGGTPSDVPLGYLFLLQFVVHDLTWGSSGRLELRPLYGDGPESPGAAGYFRRDRRSLRLGSSSGNPRAEDAARRRDLPEFDLPRADRTVSSGQRRAAQVPDVRSDENVGLGQTHVAIARFHNELLTHTTGPKSSRFTAARTEAVLHYQWLVRTDILPRVVLPEIVDEVFRDPADPVAAQISREGAACLRFVHSMLTPGYAWNKIFPGSPELGVGMLVDQFSEITPTLPTILIPDQHRLYRFPAAHSPTSTAKRIDTFIFNPYQQPRGTFGGDVTYDYVSLAERDLRFSNVQLPTGQEMATALHLPALGASRLLGGDGAKLDSLTEEERATLASATPLLFYILREAELNGGRLGAVGGRLVAQEIRDAIARSEPSILRARPALHDGVFGMTDLLLTAFQNKPELLNPLGVSLS